MMMIYSMMIHSIVMEGTILGNAEGKLITVEAGVMAVVMVEEVNKIILRTVVGVMTRTVMCQRHGCDCDEN